MRDMEGEAETQVEGETGSLWEARGGPKDHTWAKGRCSTAEPPRGPTFFFSNYFKMRRPNLRLIYTWPPSWDLQSYTVHLQLIFAVLHTPNIIPNLNKRLEDS